MGAADWGTEVALLQKDLRNLADADTVKQALIASIRHHRNLRVYQSEASFSFTLDDGVADYRPGDPASALPVDFQEPIGETFWAVETGTSHRLPVNRVTPEQMEQLRATDPHEAQTPRYWDIYARAVRLWPTPDDSGTVLEGRYQLDLGVPIVQRVGGVYKYFKPRPDEATEITDAYAPGWFHELNVQAVEAYTKHLLWAGLKDYESSQYWYSIWEDRKADIQDEIEGLTGPPQIVPWPSLATPSFYD